MRLLKIFTLVMLAALVVAGVASASVRQSMLTVADTAEDVLSAVTDPTPSATPTDDSSASPSTAPSVEPSTASSEEPAPDDVLEEETDDANHGETVSAVARDKDAIATWENPAGKEITNHGKAVSAVAHKDAGDHGDDGDTEAAGGAGHGQKDK